MAKYNVARDGHPYLTHGYPIIDDRGEEDVRFCTYQLNPRAEHLFEKARLEEGDVLSRETFYALRAEGSIYNDARPNGIPITAVPKSVLRQAEEAERHLRLNLTGDRIAVEHAPFVVDVFDVIAREYGITPEAPSASSWFCLFRKWRGRDISYERQVRSRGRIRPQERSR